MSQRVQDGNLKYKSTTDGSFWLVKRHESTDDWRPTRRRHWCWWLSHFFHFHARFFESQLNRDGCRLLLMSFAFVAVTYKFPSFEKYDKMCVDEKLFVMTIPNMNFNSENSNFFLSVIHYHCWTIQFVYPHKMLKFHFIICSSISTNVNAKLKNHEQMTGRPESE